MNLLQHKLWIDDDPDLLRQAMLNVVNNGLEAMAAGGTLTTRTAGDDGHCRLTVSDVGPGIPPEIEECL